MENNKIKLKDTQIESSQIIDNEREKESRLKGFTFPVSSAAVSVPFVALLPETHTERAHFSAD